MSFGHVSIILWVFPCFLAQKWSRVICLPWPNPRLSYFSKEPNLPFVEVGGNPRTVVENTNAQVYPRPADWNLQDFRDGDEQVWAPGRGPRSCSFLFGLQELRVHRQLPAQVATPAGGSQTCMAGMKAEPWFLDRKGLIAFLASPWVSWVAELVLASFLGIVSPTLLQVLPCLSLAAPAHAPVWGFKPQTGAIQYLWPFSV